MKPLPQHGTGMVSFVLSGQMVPSTTSQAPPVPPFSCTELALVLLAQNNTCTRFACSTLRCRGYALCGAMLAEWFVAVARFAVRVSLESYDHRDTGLHRLNTSRRAHVMWCKNTSAYNVVQAIGVTGSG